jgi:hypothetical protein
MIGFTDHSFTITRNHNKLQYLTSASILFSMLIWSESQSYVTTDGQSVSRSVYLGVKHPSGTYDQFFITVWQLPVCSCGALSLTRGRVCRLQLLLAFASAVVHGSESPGSRDHILLSQIRDSPNLEGQVLIFISPRNRVAQLYSHALGPLFVASNDSQGYGGGIRKRLHAGYSHLNYDWLCCITSGRTDRQDIFNLISKEMFVDYSSQRKHLPITSWFPRIHLYGNVLSDRSVTVGLLVTICCCLSFRMGFRHGRWTCGLHLILKGSVFWDVARKQVKSADAADECKEETGRYAARFMLTLQVRRWRQYVSAKRQLTFPMLHCVISSSVRT